MDLQNQLIAAACNIKRWFRKLLGTAFGGQKEDLGLSGAFALGVLAAFFVPIARGAFPRSMPQAPGKRQKIYRCPDVFGVTR